MRWDFDDINDQDEFGDTQLHRALRAVDLEGCKQLLERGADFRLRGKNSFDDGRHK